MKGGTRKAETPAGEGMRERSGDGRTRLRDGSRSEVAVVHTGDWAGVLGAAKTEQRCRGRRASASQASGRESPLEGAREASAMAMTTPLDDDRPGLLARVRRRRQQFTFTYNTTHTPSPWPRNT
jgi:hypothetical protein